MKIVVKPIFEIDITDWYNISEGMSKEKYLKNLCDEFKDISVFTNHINYENLKSVETEIIK